MTTVPVALSTAPVDIAVALSANAFPAAGANPGGRGAVRLFNSAGNASLYVLIRGTAPDGTVPPVRVRPGEWFPEPVDVRPAADGGDRVWAWASRDDVTVTALIVRWS